jgi:hypothetical protein
MLPGRRILSHCIKNYVDVRIVYFCLLQQILQDSSLSVQKFVRPSHCYCWEVLRGRGLLMIMLMEWTTALNYGHLRPYCSSCRWYMGMENHGVFILDRVKLRLLPLRPLWQSYQQLSDSKAGGTYEENFEFCRTKYLCSYFEGIFNLQ